MSAAKGYGTNPPWGLFPPYGFMNADDMEVVLKSKQPEGWLGDYQSYETWLAGTLKLIQDSLWPVFDQKTNTWTGASAAWMEALTRFDLDLLRVLYTKKPYAIDLPTTAPNGLLPLKTHHQLFNDEDLEVSHWGEAYRHYDQNWTPDQVNDLISLIGAAYQTRVGGSVLRLKYALQRPRPYQMAMILGYADFTYYEALTADTPSMVCGHCAQGLLLVGAVMERLILGGTPANSPYWDALEQFAVDIGDRRVMARVHYPSDALSSWIMVLSMAKYVFATDEVRKHLFNAITKRSLIYKLMSQAGGFYKDPLKLLAHA